MPLAAQPAAQERHRPDAFSPRRRQEEPSAMAVTPNPHLNWVLDQHYRGESIRLAAALGTLDPGIVTAVDFALELDTTSGPSAVRATAALVSSVTPGQNGVQLIDPVDANPPEAPGTTVYELVIETGGATNLPAGVYRAEVWITWPFGRRVVSAGRLRLREPALT
jgi:hypothetical protein